MQTGIRQEATLLRAAIGAVALLTHVPYRAIHSRGAANHYEDGLIAVIDRVHHQGRDLARSDVSLLSSLAKMQRDGARGEN